jgi:hypothetical protein
MLESYQRCGSRSILLWSNTGFGKAINPHQEFNLPIQAGVILKPDEVGRDTSFPGWVSKSPLRRYVPSRLSIVCGEEL